MPGEDINQNAYAAVHLKGAGPVILLEEEVTHAHVDRAEPDPLLVKSELDDEWEGFHAKLEAMEERSEWDGREEEGATGENVSAEGDKDPRVELLECV